MPEYPVPESESQFEENFRQIHPLMKDTEAYYESSRCLFCYNAPCTLACPTRIDVPLFIRQINTGNVAGAARTIYSANYLGGVCGKVCPTEELCEGACVFNKQDVKAIEIGRLQFYAVNKVVSAKSRLFDVPSGKVTGGKIAGGKIAGGKIAGGKIAGGKIAVIGAGPAGLSCACELRLSGYTVEIFEAETVPSGLTLFGIAPYKIRNQEVLDEVRYLEDQFGFTIHYSRLISREEELKKLEKEYDAIFLGIGLGNTIGTSLPGEDLPGCVGATEFIRDLKVTHQGVEIGKKVIVLGGGNTAMDAASEAARLGAAEIILAYRRSRQEKPAYDFEYMLARGAGVRGLFNVAPVAIRGSRAVEGVRFIRTKTAGGRIEVIEGSEFDVPCDMVIRATGQEKKTSLLKLIKGLSFDRKGCIVTDPVTFQTGNRRFFAGGDAVNGGAEVVNAAAEGKAAARGIHAYISGKEA